jgi:hypothetical protein
MTHRSHAEIDVQARGLTAHMAVRDRTVRDGPWNKQTSKPVPANGGD